MGRGLHFQPTSPNCSQTRSKMSTVAFFGLGNMGAPMASNVFHKNAGLVSSLLLFDVRPEAAVSLAEELKAAAGPSQVKAVTDMSEVAAADPDVVITMVPASSDLCEIVVGSRDLPAGNESPVATSSLLGAIIAHRKTTGNSKRMLLLDMTSGEPGLTAALAELLEKHDIGTVDAPVSGGVPRAKPGTLAIMIGGKPADVAVAEPLLKLMGTSLTVCGERVGSGQCMKALNNYVSTAGFLAVVEALVAGKQFGLDTDLMVDVMNNGTAMNNSTKNKMKQFVLNHAYNAGFGLDLLVKVRNAFGEAQQATNALLL